MLSLNKNPFSWNKSGNISGQIGALSLTTIDGSNIPVENLSEDIEVSAASLQNCSILCSPVDCRFFVGRNLYLNLRKADFSVSFNNNNKNGGSLFQQCEHKNTSRIQMCTCALNFFFLIGMALLNSNNFSGEKRGRGSRLKLNTKIQFKNGKNAYRLYLHLDIIVLMLELSNLLILISAVNNKKQSKAFMRI